MYTAPSAPTNTVCAPPAHTATASTGSWTIRNLALDKPSASSPDPEGPWPSRPWSPFPADTAHVAYARAGEGPVRDARVRDAGAFVVGLTKKSARQHPAAIPR